MCCNRSNFLDMNDSIATTQVPMPSPQNRGSGQYPMCRASKLTTVSCVVLAMRSVRSTAQSSLRFGESFPVAQQKSGM